MKHIAFDIGNVICRLNFGGFLTALDFSTGKSVDTDQFLIRLQRPHDLGLATMEEELKAFGVNDWDMKSLMAEWAKTIPADQTMISFIEDLIDNGTNVALLSNIGFEHADQMIDTLGSKVYDNSTRFFSCEVGARKPTLLYYKTFLDIHPEFKGCVYLDDKIENVEGGQRMGLNGIQFDLEKYTTPSTIKKRLKEILL